MTFDFNDGIDEYEFPAPSAQRDDPGQMFQEPVFKVRIGIAERVGDYHWAFAAVYLKEHDGYAPAGNLEVRLDGLELSLLASEGIRLERSSLERVLRAIAWREAQAALSDELSELRRTGHQVVQIKHLDPVLRQLNVGSANSV